MLLHDLVRSETEMVVVRMKRGKDLILDEGKRQDFV